MKRHILATQICEPLDIMPSFAVVREPNPSNKRDKQALTHRQAYNASVQAAENKEHKPNNKDQPTGRPPKPSKMIQASQQQHKQNTQARKQHQVTPSHPAEMRRRASMQSARRIAASAKERSTGNISNGPACSLSLNSPILLA